MKLPDELQFIINNRKPIKTTNARMDGKVCVISGTTSGIGYEVAKVLAEKGAHLVMVNRSEEKAIRVKEELVKDYGAKVACYLADFQSLAQVRQVALEIKQDFPQIDLLINNAGVFNKRRVLTPDGNEMVLGVIHLASLLLTQLLLDNLKKGAPSRVLFVSSEAHRFGGLSLKDLDWKKRPFIGLFAYGAAKIAQIQTSIALAEQHQKSGVTFNLVHPGAVKTAIGMNNNIFYRLYKRFILNWFLKDPTTSARAIYYLAADPSLENITGKYFNMTTEEKPAGYTVRPSQQKAVWDLSEARIEAYLKG